MIHLLKKHVPLLHMMVLRDGAENQQTKRSRCSLNGGDMLDTLKTLQSRSEEISGKKYTLNVMIYKANPDKPW